MPALQDVGLNAELLQSSYMFKRIWDSEPSDSLRKQHLHLKGKEWKYDTYNLHQEKNEHKEEITEVTFRYIIEGTKLYDVCFLCLRKSVKQI